MGAYDRSHFATPVGSPGLGQGHRYDPEPHFTEPASREAGGTPGGEADGEDKRVRNTMACKSQPSHSPGAVDYATISLSSGLQAFFESETEEQNMKERG